MHRLVLFATSSARHNLPDSGGKDASFIGVTFLRVHWLRFFAGE